jgi:hypothetical protein
MRSEEFNSQVGATAGCTLRLLVLYLKMLTHTSME